MRRPWRQRSLSRCLLSLCRRPRHLSPARPPPKIRPAESLPTSGLVKAEVWAERKVPTKSVITEHKLIKYQYDRREESRAGIPEGPEVLLERLHRTNVVAIEGDVFPAERGDVGKRMIADNHHHDEAERIFVRRARISHCVEDDHVSKKGGAPTHSS